MDSSWDAFVKHCFKTRNSRAWSHDVAAAADDAYDLAISNAEQARQHWYDAARQQYDMAIEAAQNNYNDALAVAQSEFDNAHATAEQDLDDEHHKRC